MHLDLADIQLYPSSPVGSRRLWHWRAVSIPCSPQATLLTKANKANSPQNSSWIAGYCNTDCVPGEDCAYHLTHSHPRYAYELLWRARARRVAQTRRRALNDTGHVLDAKALAQAAQAAIS